SAYGERLHRPQRVVHRGRHQLILHSPPEAAADSVNLIVDEPATPFLFDHPGAHLFERQRAELHRQLSGINGDDAFDGVLDVRGLTGDGPVWAAVVVFRPLPERNQHFRDQDAGRVWIAGHLDSAGQHLPEPRLVLLLNRLRRLAGRRGPRSGRTEVDRLPGNRVRRVWARPELVTAEVGNVRHVNMVTTAVF